MTKPKFETSDMTQKNIEKIAQLFPNCITESKDENGKRKKAVNFELLQQMLKCDIADKDEAYEFTWVGKNAAIVEANKPIRKTLRPCKEESVDWDTTENLYIEGDNLEVLKLLQESYLGKVKMIYIDPPYNTGNDFIYNDDFKMSGEEYADELGELDEDGNRLFKNTETNGRFHSDWCSMIYSRLMLARNLLSDDGVIFISIDDNEQDNLKKICDEVFGAENFVAIFPWRKRTAKSDVPFGVSQDYEWIICYAKSNNFMAGVKGNERKYYETDDFPNRPWRIHDLTKQTTASERPNSFFTIVNPKTHAEYPANPNRTWAITQETFEEYYANNRIVFPDDYDFLNISKPVLRYWKEDDEKKAGDRFGQIAVSTKLPENIGMSQDGTKEITELLGTKAFPYPKSVELIKYLIKISTNNSQLKTNNYPLILDFFSGSATTAHAVMQLNAEDGGNRKFIMVQLPEPCDEKSEAYKAGYKTICEIGKERIRRAGKKISEQWLVDSGQKKGGKNGCSKLQGIADMAEGNADCEGDLFTGEETSQGRDLCSIRPNEAGSSVDSVKHSGGAVKEFNEGVHSLPVDNERLKGGTRNTASSLQGNRISDGRGNSTSDELVARGKQNALYDESKTDNSQLTTDNCPLDIGFRVLKVDDTNMKDVYYAPSEYDQGKLDGLESNIKEDRNDLDLLFGCLLDWGLPLSLPYTSESIGKFTVHTYNNGDLIACFNEDVSEDIVKEIARKKPLRAVFRDSSFSNSASKINVFEIFKMISPETSVKVI